MAEQVTQGSWTARWGDWLIKLRVREASSEATVWRWTTGGGYTERQQLGWRGGFSAPVDAVKWACDVLRDSGAKVMILGAPSITLESMLRFAPAPEACA